MSIPENSRERGVWLVSTPPTLLQRRLTAGGMIVLLLIFVPAAWFANIRFASSAGFIPFIQGLMIVTELITAVLLYTHFAILRSRAILVLASGYLFSSLIILAHTLVFPGAFGQDGLFGQVQTAAWLHIIWHFFFPAAALGYASIKNTPADDWDLTPSSARSVIFSIVVILPIVVVGITWGLSAADEYVPRLMQDRPTFTLLASQLGLFDALVCLVAFSLLWLRQDSILDRWILVALFATLLEMTMVVMLTGRYSLGWYSVRIFGVTASTVVLIALLTETTVLYAGLASALTLLRREHTNRLTILDAATAAMAHELRQPLTAIGASSAAALNLLKKAPPDLDLARDCLASIIANNHRTDDVISSVRELFKKREQQRKPIRVDEVARHVLVLLQTELKSNEVSIAVDFRGDLAEVHADPVQLQQVILNLIQNAITAMKPVPPHGRHLRLATTEADSSVLLSVQDSGPGIEISNPERVFDPFFTTKRAGMGLGLAICRTIVEDHGGKLRLAKTDIDGCIFEIALPIAANGTKSELSD